MRRWSGGVFLVCAAALVCGCLKREVTYTIGADGSASVQFVARGDAKDIAQGDLMPPKESWTVKESETTDKKGNKEHVYEATRSFAHVSQIAPNLATAQTRFANVYLQTPVTLRVKRENGLSVYEFAVTYKARRWREYHDLLNQIMGADLAELMKRYGAEKLTPAEKQAVLAAFVRWGLRLEYDRVAAAVVNASAGGGLPGEKAMAILGKVDGALDALSSDEAIQKIADLPDEAKGKAMEDLRRQACEEIDRILLEELPEPQYAKTIEKIRDKIAEARLEWDVTNDLGDEHFTVNVEMPGTIVKTNADKVEGNRATWTFNSERFRDADYEMKATSRVMK